MEFEKGLYNIHERILTGPGMDRTMLYVFGICCLIGGFTLPVFIYANVAHKDNNMCLLMAKDQYLQDKWQTNPGFALFDDDVFRFTIVDENAVYSDMEVSADYALLDMRKANRKLHNFTIHNITIQHSCLASNVVTKFITRHSLGLDNILVNEIVTTFRNDDVYIKNLLTGESIGFTLAQMERLNDQQFIRRVLFKITMIIRLFFGQFLLSNITALYGRAIIIASPILLIVMLSCTRREALLLQLYRRYKWIGMYLHALSFGILRQYQRWILLAFFLLLTIFYFIFVTSVYISSYFLFAGKDLPHSTDHNYYTTVFILEFLGLIFLRTRSSIKYYPPFVLMTTFMFLVYTNTTTFGYPALALTTLNFLNYAFFCFILIKFEIPALTWSQEKSYTPSINRPRTLYFPAFSLNWDSDLPQLWTMFFPLVGREGFENSHLAYVDQNQQQLNQILEGGGGAEEASPLTMDENSPAAAALPQIMIPVPVPVLQSPNPSRPIPPTDEALHPPGSQNPDINININTRMLDAVDNQVDEIIHFQDEQQGGQRPSNERQSDHQNNIAANTTSNHNGSNNPGNHNGNYQQLE